MPGHSPSRSLVHPSPGLCIASVLLDRFGNRLTENTAPFDRTHVEELVDDLV